MRAAKVSKLVFENPIFHMHARFFKFSGIICENVKSEKILHLNFFQALFTTILFYNLCFLNYLTVKNGLESEDGLDILTCATGCLMTSTAILLTNFLVQRKRVARLLNFIAEDFPKMQIEKDAAELRVWQSTLRYVHYATQLPLKATIASAGIPLLDFVIRIFLNPEHYFNMENIEKGTTDSALLLRNFPIIKIWHNYLAAYLLPFVLTIFGQYAIPLQHTFAVVLMKYVEFKLTILSKRIAAMDVSRIPKESVNSVYGKITGLTEEQSLRMELCRFCIQEQVKARWLIGEINTLITPMVFCDFVIFSMLFCFLFYTLVLDMGANVDTFFKFCYLSFCFAMLWLYHWHAVLVAQAVEDFRLAIYFSPWYECPIVVQKTLYLMSMEAARPVLMKAVFVRLHVETFVQIVRGAFGYYNILSGSYSA